MRWRAAGITFAIVFASSAVFAQHREEGSMGARSPDRTPSHPHDLRGRFGTEMAKRLMDSTDSATRLRGIERASSVGTAEAVLLLTQRAEKASWKNDPREALALVRALAGFSDRAPVRDALMEFVKATMGSSRSAALPVDRDPSARFELARQTAALALVRSGDAKKISDLIRKLVETDAPGADAARLALTSTHLPPSYTLDAQALTTASGIALAARIRDARAEPALRNAAHATSSAVRAAALEALADLGDSSSISMAKDALADRSPHVRIAGARSLAMLGAPERFKAIAALVDDDATVDAGVELAATTADESTMKALARRLATATSIDLRRAVIVTLGRVDAIDAVRVLAAFAKDGAVASDIARALAASPNSAAMPVIDKMIADPKTSTLGVRAYVVRRKASGEKSDVGDDAVDALARSRDGGARALGVFSALVLGRGDLAAALDDHDARVRRAAALAMQDPRFASERGRLLERLPKESDEATRVLSAIGLLDADARVHVPTLALVDRAKSGSADAPLAAYARVARKSEASDDIALQQLASPDAITRAHAARGLAESTAPDATGLLANAYTEETETDVRRAIVLALAAASPADSISRTSTLKLAASLDPDPRTRLLAVRALAAMPPVAPPQITQVAWLHLETSDGSKAPAAMLGSVLRSDGFAVPVVFDDEGFALVPGMPPGEARLVLAPRFPLDLDASKVTKPGPAP